MADATQVRETVERLTPDRLEWIRLRSTAGSAMSSAPVRQLLAELDAVTAERDGTMAMLRQVGEALGHDPDETIQATARRIVRERDEADRVAGSLSTEMPAFHRRLELALGLNSESESAPDVWGRLAEVVRDSKRLDFLALLGCFEVNLNHVGQKPYHVFLDQGDRELGQGADLREAVDAAQRHSTEESVP
jgi:hypothetical protein